MLKTMVKLRDVEDQIINEVSKNEDANKIIEANKLTEMLVSSRINAKNIGKSLMEIKNSMVHMMRVSRLYKPLSVRAAKFFYLIMDLSKLNNMYQFTHEWFKKFFADTVRRHKSMKANKRHT